MMPQVHSGPAPHYHHIPMNCLGRAHQPLDRRHCGIGFLTVPRGSSSEACTSRKGRARGGDTPPQASPSLEGPSGRSLADSGWL